MRTHCEHTRKEKMASLRKLKSGKWQVIIRKKHQPQIIKSFIDKSTARKYGKDVEARMDRNIQCLI